MLRLSQTTGYAIKSLACLCERTLECQQTADIARCAGVSTAYLPKIIQALARAGLVVAKRGIGGGITLARKPEEISLLQIVEAVEGPEWLGDCLLGLDECTSLATCPTHNFWIRIRGEITAELRNTSLAAIIAFRTQCRETSGRRAADGKALPSGARGPAARPRKRTV